MFGSLVFSILAKLCSHCYYLFLKHFLSSHKETRYPLAFSTVPSHPSPWQPLIFLSLWIYLFQTFHVDGSYSTCGLLWPAFSTSHCVSLFLLALGLCCVQAFVASGGHSWPQCISFSLRWLFLQQSTDSRRMGFHCSAACGILPDQELNPCRLHRQVHSYPLYHQGSPASCFQGSSMLYNWNSFAWAFKK